MTTSLYFTCSIFLVSFMFLMLLVLPSPTSLMMAFMGLVVCSTYGLFLHVGDIFSYLLFLVYVGGLLVLLIYLIMLSSNYMMVNYSLLCCIFVLMFMFSAMNYLVSDFLIMSANSMIKTIEYSGLLVLGSLLTFIFLYVCNMMSLGGISINVGKIS